MITLPQDIILTRNDKKKSVPGSITECLGCVATCRQLPDVEETHILRAGGVKLFCKNGDIIFAKLSNTDLALTAAFDYTEGENVIPHKGSVITLKERTPSEQKGYKRPYTKTLSEKSKKAKRDTRKKNTLLGRRGA